MRTALTALIVVLISATAAAQRGRAPALPELPPLSMTCIHHPDVLEERPGTCPQCKMALVPVRLDSAWMCPVHTTIIEAERGSCRLCRRQLVPVTVALAWACRNDGTTHLEPGLCGDGSPRVGSRTLRPHGNHNPRHGGQFFMAPDNWHHLEGAYPAARSFRLYVYDDYGRPLPAAALRKVEARLVTEEVFDPAARKTTELTTFPLRVARGGSYLEARVSKVTFPAEMTAKVRFEGAGDEHRFDFTFDAITKEPAAPTSVTRVTGTTTPSTPARAAAASATVTAAPAEPTTAPAAEAYPTSQAIPTSMEGILALLQVRGNEVRDLVARGDFAAVWVPAFQAKDLAIALEPHLAHLAPDRRESGEPAIARLVRGAWLLDAAGDVGNRQHVEAAHAVFTSAVADVLAAFR